MKILYIHNNYASNNSGEEYAAEGLVHLLIKNGHKVEWYRRSSAELDRSTYKKGLAFFTGIWNPKAVNEVKQKIKEFQPDVVQIQNLYPLISPAILRTIKNEGIPVVMRCPNYRLFCPNGLHLDNKAHICEKCLTPGREIHCIVKNCERNQIKSLGYAIRNYTARCWWGILKLVDVYIVQSEFQKQKFIKNGIPENKITIVPGLTPDIPNHQENKLGDLVSFVGRVSLEKGIKEFIEAAGQLAKINFVVAGSFDPNLLYLKKNSPANITWTGFLKENELDQLYHNSRIIVTPGKWYEGFPNVITRAMKHGKPVITSNLGAMASIIDHKSNGILVEPGNTKKLTQAINELYNNTGLCLSYGKKGQQKAKEYFSSEKVYQKLISIYISVIE